MERDAAQLTTDALGYDPFAPEVIADPYPWYRSLLEDHPVFHHERLDFWTISRYDDVWQAVRDHAVLSSAEGVTYLRIPLPMMLTMDPPAHTRLRRLVARDFTPRAVERWRPVVERLVREMLDEMLEGRSVDLVASLAEPLPVEVIAALMGIPREDRDRFRRWSDTIVEGFALADQPERLGPELVVLLDAARDLNAYFVEPLEDRRTSPRDDLLTRLRQPHDGEELTGDELFGFCLLLLVAGNETTTNLLGNMTVAFLDHPDQWRVLTEQPELVPAAVEEALRFESPIQGLFRTTVDSYRVGRDAIPAGGRVLLLFAAANRDPRHFPDPDRFTIKRNPSDHVAFGGGIHHCLGASLARLEVEVVLRELLARTAGIDRDGDVVRTANPTLRGVARLPVVLRPA